MAFFSDDFRGSVVRLLLFFTVPFIIFPWPLAAQIDEQYREKIESLVAKLGAAGFQQEEVRRIFFDQRVTLYPHILERSGKGLPYFGKKFGLLTKTSIGRGQKVLRDNEELLSKIEKDYGVDKEIIIAILRIESNFSSYPGKYPIFNSLLTFALMENRRSEWAEAEIVELFRVGAILGTDPLSIKGSWAGAFGMAQFIPSSYVKYAVDGNGDGVSDLFNFSDAAASIANYLKAHGWQPKEREKSRQAIYAYNRCDEYVKAVFAYAKALKK